MSETSTDDTKTSQVLRNVDQITHDEVSAKIPHAAAQPRPATLITERLVVFSTVVVLAVRPIRWWVEAVRLLAVAPRRIFATAPANSRPKRRHYPEHTGFIEDSRMEREMHRL